jgi:cytidylate kinase
MALNKGIKGVYDKGILKAVFLAGGSGSGKSAVSNALFGLNFGFAPSGLKNVNNDKFFEFLLERGKLSKDMTNLNDKEMSIIQDVRKKGKALGTSQYQMYLNGHLGMVIDGTGDSYVKIAEQKKYLQSLGYDCIMVFVNTTLEKALERNMKRERKVPVDVATTIWKAAQQMKKRYAGLFKTNFTEIDNSTDSPTGKVQIANKIQKKIDTFLNAPVRNPKGKAWIKSELAKKKNKPEGEFVFV